LFKILCLFAALLMPFGMHMAEAAPSHAHDSSAAVAMDHCTDHSRNQESGKGAITCSILCAAALPDAAALEHELRPVRMTAVSSTQASLTGILPDIAAPPPRNA